MTAPIHTGPLIVAATPDIRCASCLGPVVEAVPLAHLLNFHADRAVVVELHTRVGRVGFVLLLDELASSLSALALASTRRLEVGRAVELRTSQ